MQTKQAPVSKAHDFFLLDAQIYRVVKYFMPLVTTLRIASDIVAI